ncbi:MAG TPA: hypothetical protein VI278_00820 [Nitrososphaeraceae archaeon]
MVSVGEISGLGIYGHHVKVDKELEVIGLLIAASSYYIPIINNAASILNSRLDGPLWQYGSDRRERCSAYIAKLTSEMSEYYRRRDIR